VASSSCLPGLPGVYPYYISPLHKAPLNTPVLMLEQKLAKHNKSGVPMADRINVGLVSSDTVGFLSLISLSQTHDT
jgi:hypothetical protein